MCTSPMLMKIYDTACGRQINAPEGFHSPTAAGTHCHNFKINVGNSETAKSRGVSALRHELCRRDLPPLCQRHGRELGKTMEVLPPCLPGPILRRSPLEAVRYFPTSRRGLFFRICEFGPTLKIDSPDGFLDEVIYGIRKNACPTCHLPK